MDRFFISSIPPNAQIGTYELPLVFFSYLVAAFASYHALALTDRLIHAASIFERRFFHWGGAFIMGMGIWLMHFIGMLSYKMPMLTYYNPGITLLSLLIAIAASYASLWTISLWKTIKRWQYFLGAALMGLGICGMHYTGMAAMEVDGDLRYIPSLFIMSVAIAIGSSLLAIWTAFNLAGDVNNRYKLTYRVSAAMILGEAICGMHYTGMFAAVFIPFADCRYDPNQNFAHLFSAIIVVTCLNLMITLAMNLYQKPP